MSDDVSQVRLTTTMITCVVAILSVCGATFIFVLNHEQAFWNVSNQVSFQKERIAAMEQSIANQTATLQAIRANAENVFESAIKPNTQRIIRLETDLTTFKEVYWKQQQTDDNRMKALGGYEAVPNGGNNH
jgi:Tfp pilus assembly protein PilO